MAAVIPHFVSHITQSCSELGSSKSLLLLPKASEVQTEVRDNEGHFPKEVLMEIFITKQGGWVTTYLTSLPYLPAALVLLLAGPEKVSRAGPDWWQ